MNGQQSTETSVEPHEGCCAEHYLDVACRNAPVVKNTMDTYGALPLSAYVERITPEIPHPYQPRNDLADAVCQYAAPVLGQAVARRAADDLMKYPFVLTANHHGVDYFSQSVQGSLIFSLNRAASGHGTTTVPVFFCGNVPLDNLTFPLGMLLYFEKMS